ncbi:MAG: NADH-quinone oxidoreductase subunit L, partial [Longimicrobiales bacterium]
FMPVTWITMWIATLAIAGIWPFAGFFSKDEIIWYVGAWAGATGAPFPGLYRIYWILALVAAMLTAFYMTRMMIMTFHGDNRTGTEEAAHLHKAPAVMTVPLMILAALSVFGGWINVPADLKASVFGLFGALPMSEWLHHWLEPITHAATEIQTEHIGEVSHYAPLGGGEVMWAGISTLLAIAVVLVSSRVIGARTVRVATEDGEPQAGLPKLLYNKWYVDELYDRIIVQPILRLSRWCWRVVDSIIIDGLVNFVGNFTRLTGWISSLFQTGQVNLYAFVLTLGALFVLGAALF